MLSLACAYYLTVSPSSSDHRLRQNSVCFHCTVVNALLVTDVRFWGFFSAYVIFMVPLQNLLSLNKILPSLSHLGVLQAGFFFACFIFP